VIKNFCFFAFYEIVSLVEIGKKLFQPPSKDKSPYPEWTLVKDFHK